MRNGTKTTMNTGYCPGCGAKLVAPAAMDRACPQCGFDLASAPEHADADMDQAEVAATQQGRDVKGKPEKECLPAAGRLLSKIAICVTVLGLGTCVLMFLWAFVIEHTGGSGGIDHVAPGLFAGTLVFLLGLTGIITSRLGLSLVRRGLSGKRLTPVLILLWPAVLLILLFAASWIPLSPLNGPHLQMEYLAGQRNFREVDLHFYDLQRICLRGANLYEADLSGADLRGANLYEADLSGADLSGADLSGADLREADLDRADLRGAELDDQTKIGDKWRLVREIATQGGRKQNLAGADLSRACLRVVDLSGADLSGANLRGADLEWASLEGAHLDRAGLRGVNLYEADLSGADLSGADLSGADLREADLDRVNLRGAELDDQTKIGDKWRLVREIATQGGRKQNLAAADLSRACLNEVDLSGADLSSANLRGADLSGADLSGADLGGANLRGADLSGADLSGAQLSGADLSGADLSGAQLSGADLSGADLSRANLTGADVTDEQLAQAASLNRATMPDGTEHE